MYLFNYFVNMYTNIKESVINSQSEKKTFVFYSQPSMVSLALLDIRCRVSVIINNQIINILDNINWIVVILNHELDRNE